MMLIADGGSTKIDWALIENKASRNIFQSHGVNPYYYKADEIEKLLREGIPQDIPLQEIRQIFFYGAGCSNEQRINRVKRALAAIFPRAGLFIDHDMLGAAKALCGDEPGFATILGTGSNACYYNGHQITEQRGGTGFILGDEGSGAYIGKKLIRNWLYHELPPVIREDFEETFGTDSFPIVDKIYRQPKPNRYLASFAPFISSHLDHPFMNNLVYQSFTDFFERHIIRFEQYPHAVFNALGSVAHHFSDMLAEVAGAYRLTPGKIIQKPIDDLISYHNRTR